MNNPTYLPRGNAKAYAFAILSKGNQAKAARFALFQCAR